LTDVDESGKTFEMKFSQT